MIAWFIFLFKNPTFNAIRSLWSDFGPYNSASALGAVDQGCAPRPCHTKGGKNGTGSSLADACNKRDLRVVPGRYKKGIRLFITRYVAVKALQSLFCRFQKCVVKQTFFIFTTPDHQTPYPELQPLLNHTIKISKVH